MRKIEETEAIRHVPTRIGQNGASLLVTEKKRNIAPMKEIMLATLRTLSAGYLSNRYAAIKHDGGEHRANDTAHIFTGTVESKL